MTPEQIQQMIAGFQGMSPTALSQAGGMYKDASGQGIHANYAGGYNPMTGDYEAGAPSEYWVSGPGASRAASSPVDVYNPQGQQTGTTNYTPATDIEKQLLKYGIALAGVGAAGGMFGGGLGGAGGAAGDAFMPGALGVDGAAMSTAPLSGLEGYVAGGASGVGGSVAGDMFMPGQLGANYTPGAIPGLESYVASGGGGLLKGLGGAVGDSKALLGAAATLAGGLLGSKPQTQSQTSTRTTDPRFDPAINGLLGLLQNQIGQTPQRSTIGQITPAGNPFTRK